MSQPSDKLAILFADISGSTMLYETLGNSAARQVVVRCLNLMSSRLAAHHGTLIKTIGDEIMCTFPSAEAAMRTACDMQEAVKNGKPGGDTPIYVRIGFNYGEVIHETNDVHGDAVNVAARITQTARARQILATQAAVDALPADLRRCARHIRRASIKGRQTALDLFQIAWSADGGDRFRVGDSSDRKPEDQREELVLRSRDQVFAVSEHSVSAVLGSGESCAIVVRGEFASDEHAIVEYQLGKFFVADRSERGTYINFSGGETVHIVAENTLLHGSGVISLGRPLSENPAEIIEFSLHLAPIPA